MTGAISLLAAAALLPTLPAQGLALETSGGVQLQTLRGRPLTSIPGVDLAVDRKLGAYLMLRDRRGRLFVLDAVARRLRRYYDYPQQARGCHGLISFMVCKRTIKVGGKVVAGAPRGSPSGYWEWAEPSRDRSSILAQWIAECEVPTAYIVRARRLRAIGRVSVALGWLTRDVALVHIIQGDCGLPRGSGIYAVPRRGPLRLVLRTKPRARYAMWGG
jgi:hypothetical protein